MMMVITMIPTHFFPQALADDGTTANTCSNPPKDDVKGDEDDNGNTDLEDFFWDILKYKFVPEVDATGLPEGASADIEVLDSPFTSKRGVKSGSKGGSIDVSKFLDFYDIKALDADGNEIHPTGEVEVTISNARIKKNQPVYLIHVLDNEDVIRNADNITLISNTAFVRAFPDAAEAAQKALGQSGVVAVEYIYDIAQDGRNLTFKTSSFSIFIIAENPILNVNFYKGAKSDSNKIVSIRVKRADIANEAEFNKIIYDPGIDYAPAADVLFRGWFLNNNYTVDDAERKTDPDTGAYASGAMTIVDVRNKIKEVLNAGINDGDVLDFFAMLYTQYTVTYFDEAGNVCLGRDYVMQRSDGTATQFDYRVSLDYVPYGQFENFEGWKLKSGDRFESDDAFYTNAKQNLVGIYPGGDVTAPSGTLQTETVNGVDVHEYVYKNPTWVRIKGDIYLQAESPEGKWLVFNENGKGATYIAPQFVKKNANTLDPNYDTNTELGYPKTMYRTGYSFEGWYYTKQEDGKTVIDLERPFTFGQPLTANTTVYANWIPNPTATYTVIIWKQNVKGTGYDFEQVMQFTGNSNTAISNVTYQGTGNNSVARIGNQTYSYIGFHLDHFNTNNEAVTIAPEGTSVFHVYYNRNEYTLKFQVNGATVYSPATDDTTTPQYALVDGRYVLLDRVPITEETTIPYTGTRYNITNVRNNNNPKHYGVVDGRSAPVELDRRDSNRWYYDGTDYSWGTRYYGEHYVINNNGAYAFVNGQMLPINSDGTVTTTNVVGYKWQLNGVDYEGDRYVATTSSGWTTIKEIKALYQQNIRNEFPIVGSNGVNYAGASWSPYGSSIFDNDAYISYIEDMQPESTTFRLAYNPANNYTTYHVKYYVEALEGDTNTVTFNGKQFVLHYDAEIHFQGTLYSTESEEFTNLTGFTKFGSNPAYNSNGRADFDNNHTISLYYTRNKYKIHYFDGLCVNGSNEPQEEIDLGLLKESEDIYYESDISNYGPDYYTPTRDNYVFEGWYLDEYCTQPYEFDTMPEGGVTVYAKWIQVQYRVFLHPNVPSSDTTLKWGVDEHGNEVNQAMNFRISLGGTVSVPTGQRNEYVFAGWYTDPECTKSFIPATQLNETTVTTPYNKEVDMTDPMDKYGVLGDNPYNSDATGYNGGDRFWITKKLDLYAKWRRKIIGADGMYLVYNTTDPDIDNVSSTVDPGTGTFDGNSPFTNSYLNSQYGSLNQFYCDGDLYVDGAFSYGLAACDAPANHDPELHFAYWVVQEWDASLNNGQGGFTDSDRIIYPGERFDTYFEYALRVNVSITDPTYNRETGAPEGAPAYDPNRPEHYYDYYMVIRAEYTEATPQETTVRYDANGGTWDSSIANAVAYGSGNDAVNYTSLGDDQYGFLIEVNKQFNVLSNNDPVYLTRPGYEFLGWAFSATATEPVFVGGEAVGADNLDTPNSHINTLYAVWKEIPRYSVDVVKVVDNGDLTVNKAETFTFSYTVMYPAGYVTRTDDVPASGTFTIELAAGTLTGTHTIPNIPEGSTITVTETDHSAFTTENASQTIANISQNGQVTVTNVRDTVKVKVKKVVVSPFSSDETKTFSFIATATIGDLQIALATADAGFTLAGGEEKEITVPAGATLVVTETLDNAYTTDPENGVLTLTEAKDGDELTFTNTRKTATVTVTKEVVGPATADTFAFSATSDSADIINGGSFSLANGGSRTITVPAGATVSITETANGNYFTDVTTGGTTAYNTAAYSSGVLAAGDAAEVTFTNIRKVTVVAEKTLDDNGVTNGTAAWTSAQFPITFSYTDPANGSVTQNGHVAADGSAEDNSVVVRYGTEVTVTENTAVAVNGRTVSDVFTTTDPDAVTANALTNTVMIVNKLKVAKVTVKKTVNGYADDKTTAKTFAFMLTAKLGNETMLTENFSLSHGGETTITVPAGTVVTVTETADPDFYTDVNDVETNTYTTPAALAADAAETVTFVNTRKVKVYAQKVINNSGSSDTSWNSFEFPITFTGGSDTKTGVVVQGVTALNSLPYIEVRYGTAVSVTEDTSATNNANGLTVADVFDTTYSAASVTADTPDQVITITNTRKVFTVTVKKSAQGFASGTLFTFLATGLSESEFQLGNNGTKVFENVPYGTVITVTESPDDVVFIGERTVSGATPDANGNITVTGNVDILYTNTIKTYPIVVSKTVSSLDPDDENKAFSFTVSGTTPDGTPFSYTFTLKHGQKNTDTAVNVPIEVPYGSRYTVTETVPDNFKTPSINNNGTTVNGNTASGTVSGKTTVDVTNTRDTIEIDVAKVVTYDGDKDTDFTFTIVAPGVNETRTASQSGGMTGPKVIVPKGSEVTVTETGVDTNGFTVTSVAGDLTGSTAITFTATANTTATFTNKRNPITIKVKKTLAPVDGITVEGDDALTFPVTVTWIDDDGVSHTKTYNLASGASQEIANVLYGSAITISETGLDSDFATVSGTGTFENNITNNKEYEVVNKRNTVTVTVEKTVVGTDKQFTFTPVATWDGHAVTLSEFTLGNNGSKTITLPMGSIFTVTETADPDYYTTVAIGSNTPVEDNKYVVRDPITSKLANIKFTNTEIVEIKVEKQFDGRTVTGDAARKFDISVAYTDDKNVARTADIQLADNENVTYKVLYGTTFTVNETVDTTFFKPATITGTGVTSSTETSGSNVTTTGTLTVSADGTVTVTNERDTVTVKVTKTVNGTDKSFGFTATATVEGSEAALAEADAQFSLKNGEDHTITLPKGATLIVEETQDTDYYTTVALGSAAPAQGYLCQIDGPITDNTNVINFVNTEILDVTVTKAFSGNVAGDDTRKFDVKVAYTDGSNEAHALASIVHDSLTGLADGESETFKVLYGTEFIVSEATPEYFKDPVFSHTADNAAASSDTNSVTYTINSDDVITVTNERKTVTVKVTKVINGTTGTFDFTADASLEGAAVTLAATDASFPLSSGSHTITLPMGATLTVTEATNTKYYTTVALNGETAAAGNSMTISEAITVDTNEITFTNTEILTVTVKKSFSGDVAGDDTKKFDILVAYTDASNQPQADTVSLSNADESVSFQVLYNTVFTVNETVDTALFETPTGTGDYTIVADKDITVTNARKTTTVVVTKEIVGADLTKNFTFTASAKVGDADVLFGTDTSKTFTLNGTEGNNSITITLPAGAVFTVTETKVDGYNTYVNGAAAPVAADAAATHTTGTLAADTTTTVPFKNVELVTITFKKEISNPKGVQNLPVFDDFTVNYVQEGLTGTQEIVLPADGTVKSITVEYGTEISGIAEDTTKTNTSGIAVGDVYVPSYSATSVDGKSNVTVTVTNTVKTYELKIFKITDDGVGGTFKFRLATTNLRANLTVNDTVTADSATGYYSIRLPYGTAFTVVEILEDTEHYNASLISYVPADGAAGYVLKGDGSVTINNFRNPVMVKIIKTVVSDVDADRLGTYDFRYTYTKGDTSDTQNVSIDLSEQDYVEFTVPAGSAVSVEETGVDTDVFKVEYTIGNAKTEGTTADLGTLNDIAYTVTFTNTRNLVDVTVKKIVKNFGSSAAKFPFSATWTVGSQTEDVEITGDANKLSNGGEWTFKVPYGAIVAVTEDGDSTVAINGKDYAISTAFDTTYTIDGSAEAEGLEAATAAGVTTATEFVFTNTRKDVDIKLVKTLDNKGVNDAWNTASFPLQYRITDSNNTTNWATVNVPAGETGVLLSEYDAQVKVPFGATVEVKEDTAYTPEGLHSIADTFTVTVPDEQVTTDAVTTFTVVNVRKMVDITVNKELDSDDPDENKSFTFDITTAVAATTGKQTITVGNDGKGSFTFQVPYGTDVTVKETGVSADDFDTFIDGTQTTDYIRTFTDVTDTDNGYSVTYLNKRMVNVPVTKIVESSDADDYTDKDYAFTYTWTRGDEGETDVTLTVTVTAANKSGTATVRIPYGATITVTETQITTGAAAQPVFQTLVNGVETLTTPAVAATTANVGANGAKLADLTFTNKRLYTVTITKTLNNLDVDDDWNTTDFPMSFAIENVVGSTYSSHADEALAAGEQTSFRVPHGAKVTVTENTAAVSVDGFTAGQIFNTTYANNGETVEGDLEIGVNNTRNTRKITVTKTVDSKVAADFRTYVFYKSTDNWAGAAGNGQLELTPETINVAVSSDSFEIPVGLEFTVTEDTAGAGFAGMDTYVGIGSAEKAKDNKLTVAAGLDDVTVNFLNVRVTAELTIVKNVEGEADCDRAFIFEITAKDQETGYSYTNRVIIVGNGQVTLNQLQTGYTYTVTELTGWSYEYDVKSVVASDKLQNVIVSKVGGVLSGAVSFYFVEDGTVTFGNKKNDTNWLRDEAYVSNLRYVWENHK